MVGSTRVKVNIGCSRKWNILKYFACCTNQSRLPTIGHCRRNRSSFRWFVRLFVACLVLSFVELLCSLHNFWAIQSHQGAAPHTFPHPFPHPYTKLSTTLYSILLNRSPPQLSFHHFTSFIESSSPSPPTPHSPLPTPAPTDPPTHPYPPPPPPIPYLPSSHTSITFRRPSPTLSLNLLPQHPRPWRRHVFLCFVFRPFESVILLSVVVP